MGQEEEERGEEQEEDVAAKLAFFVSLAVLAG